MKIPAGDSLSATKSSPRLPTSPLTSCPFSRPPVLFSHFFPLSPLLCQSKPKSLVLSLFWSDGGRITQEKAARSDEGESRELWTVVDPARESGFVLGFLFRTPQVYDLGIIALRNLPVYAVKTSYLGSLFVATRQIINSILELHGTSQIVH